jgi:cellulose synthase/poly-beta-1,6-N-acetylglucosamine synthase-like glycosyltransferase
VDILFQIVFWISVAAIFHSYIFFPFLLKLLAKNKTENKIVFPHDKELPSVSIIMASYNEEKHIEKKIISSFNTDYPIDKIEFLIGSDNSNDKTNSIINQLCKTYPQIRLFPFTKRQGKIKIINHLKKKANNEILVLTDTKVFFRKDTIYHLIKHFKNQKIGITGGILINNKTDKNGIYIQEDTYMNREMEIKYNEGILWGCSMGVFGAVYAIRPECFKAVPENYKVDDFYITMNVLKNNKKVIFCKEAVADEILTGNIKEEFKRKVRISTGNFQNLKSFFSVLFCIHKAYVFTFWSHKVIRWIGPLLFLCIVVSLSFLIQFQLYKIILITMAATFLIPLADLILSKMKIHIVLIRYISHFYAMNAALALGFFKFLSGVKSAVWEPSKRN